MKQLSLSDKNEIGHMQTASSELASVIVATNCSHWDKLELL